jgi:hypothetical protein
VRRQVEDVIGNAWHPGLLPGCSSALLRRYDNVNVAILFNKRDDSLGIGPFAGAFMDQHLHRLIDRVSEWPRGNLFPKFTTIPNRKPENRGSDRTLQKPVRSADAIQV